jgi:hypothetical protein
MAAARVCALGTAILGGEGSYRAAGLPWWAEFALAALALLTMCLRSLTMCLRIVFPQDSAHRLAWWRDLLAWWRDLAGRRDRRRPRRNSARRSTRRREHEFAGGDAGEPGGEASARTVRCLPACPLSNPAKPHREDGGSLSTSERKIIKLRDIWCPWSPRIL